MNLESKLHKTCVLTYLRHLGLYLCPFNPCFNILLLAQDSVVEEHKAAGLMTRDITLYVSILSAEHPERIPSGLGALCQSSTFDNLLRLVPQPLSGFSFLCVWVSMASGVVVFGKGPTWKGCARQR